MKGYLFSICILLFLFFCRVESSGSPIGATAGSTAYKFDITLNPEQPTVPVIEVGPAFGNITACAGSASVNPHLQHIQVIGLNLTSGILATAPPNFEVSLSAAGGFAAAVTIPVAAATGNGAIVYVRSAASAPATNISGYMFFTSPGAGSEPVPVAGLVNALPAVKPVSSQSVTNGANTTAINFRPYGNSFSWVNDTPAIGLAASGTGDIASFTAVNKGSTPVTATITVTPKAAGFAYIPNKADGTVTVINTATDAVTTTLNVGVFPTAATISPDGSVMFVANNGDNTISAIDVSTNLTIATFFNGTSPNSLAITPDGSTLYVANYGSNTVSVINANTYLVESDIIVGIGSFGIVVSPDGTRVYVANQTANTVSVISTATNTVIETIPVSGTPRGIAVTPDGGSIYVTNYGSNTVTVINAATYNVTATIIVGSNPSDVVLSPDGSLAYVSNSGFDTMSVINTATGNVTNTVTVGLGPSGISLTPDGRLAFVTNQNSNTVSIINTATNSLVSTVQTGGSPVAFGNFIAPGPECDNAPTTFTITVKPTGVVALPVITTGNVSGTISGCAGTASASPDIQQFTVSGVNLTNDIILTAPNNFEISLAPGSGFGGSLTITPAAGVVNSTIVYVRSAASALAGSISDHVSLTSQGAQPAAVQVTGFVNTLPTVNAVMNQSVPNGSTTQAVNFTGTGKSFSWVNDTPGIGLAVSGTGNIASFTPINKGATAVTATITVTPQPAAFAYIPNFTPNLDVVSVVNLANNSVTTTIPVGASPIGVAVNPDGTRVYTANQGSNTISVISTATNALLTTIQLAPGAEPSGIVVSADGSRVYAADYGTSYLSIIDAVTNTQITAVAVGSHPFGLALSPDGSTVYTSSEDNTVCVVNTASRSLVATINVGQVPNGICLSPDGSMLYVTNSGDNTVSVINTATNLVISSIAVGKAPVNIITSADGSIFYVTNSADNTVSVINASSGKVISVINVGSDPIGMSLNSDGSKLYVSNSVSDYVSVINTSTNAVIGTITVGTSAYAFGNFIIGGNGCAGMPVTFTITAEPALPNGISTSGVLAPLTTIYGTPSPSESFNVSGTGLIAGISVSPPTGFEVSTDNVNFSATVTVGKGGAIASTLVYVRLAAATPVGPYMGNITLSSAGVPDNDVFMPASTVNPALLSIIADDKSKTFGMANPVLTATYIGFVNFDTPVQLTSQAQLTTSAVTSSPAGQYPINVSGAASSNYTISQVPGVLTVYPVIESIVIPNTFTPNGDGINDTWNIKFLNFNLNCSVDVYNRWGEKVYSSIGYGIPWDGTYKGAALPVGTYYYIINLKTGQKALSGYVAIIR